MIPMMQYNENEGLLECLRCGAVDPKTRGCTEEREDHFLVHCTNVQRFLTGDVQNIPRHLLPHLNRFSDALRDRYAREDSVSAVSGVARVANEMDGKEGQAPELAKKVDPYVPPSKEVIASLKPLTEEFPQLTGQVKVPGQGEPVDPVAHVKVSGVGETPTETT